MPKVTVQLEYFFTSVCSIRVIEQCSVYKSVGLKLSEQIHLDEHLSNSSNKVSIY